MVLTISFALLEQVTKVAPFIGMARLPVIHLFTATALLSFLAARGSSDHEQCLIYRTASFGWGSNVFGVRAPPRLSCRHKGATPVVVALLLEAHPTWMTITTKCWFGDGPQMLMTIAGNPGTNVVIDERESVWGPGWSYKCSEQVGCLMQLLMWQRDIGGVAHCLHVECLTCLVPSPDDACTASPDDACTASPSALAAEQVIRSTTQGSWRDFFSSSMPLIPAELPDPDACEPVHYEHWPERCGELCATLGPAVLCVSG